MARKGSQSSDYQAGDRTTSTHLSGTLYVVGTPIGHLDDITLRALAVLRCVTLIASENPRMTQALLTHHGITATVTSYGPLNRHEKMLLLLHRLAEGQDVALVSDNGTPIIYDPGNLLVAAAHQAGVPVKAIPGPSAITTATAVSGFSGDAIIFEGHLPSTNRRLAQHLSQFRKERKTLVFYIGPRALTGLLKTLAQILPTRQTVIALNLTTQEETLFRGKPSTLFNQVGSVPKDSAVTVIIDGHRMVRTIKEKRKRKIARATRHHDDE
jgi:16S rRNA (cytidine1402-2'-O)-methyltransferase